MTTPCHFPTCSDRSFTRRPTWGGPRSAAPPPRSSGSILMSQSIRMAYGSPPGTVPACSEAGIVGALTGVVGSMMALEVIREIVGFGEGLVGRLLMIDARAMRFETLSYAFDPANPLSGDRPTIRDLSGHA